MLTRWTNSIVVRGRPWSINGSEWIFQGRGSGKWAPSHHVFEKEENPCRPTNMKLNRSFSGLRRNMCFIRKTALHGH